MNYNKAIKDLKERNDKLQEQYRLRDIRCIHLEYENEMLKSDFEAQHELTEKYAEENQELKLELSGYRQAILKDKEMLGLKEENQKYKEVIDKLKNKTKENIENAKCEITTLTIGDKAYYQYIEKILDNYVDILKEVE